MDCLEWLTGTVSLLYQCRLWHGGLGEEGRSMPFDPSRVFHSFWQVLCAYPVQKTAAMNTPVTGTAHCVPSCVRCGCGSPYSALDCGTCRPSGSVSAPSCPVRLGPLCRLVRTGNSGAAATCVVRQTGRPRLDRHHNADYASKYMIAIATVGCATLSTGINPGPINEKLKTNGCLVYSLAGVALSCVVGYLQE